MPTSNAQLDDNHPDDIRHDDHGYDRHDRYDWHDPHEHHDRLQCCGANAARPAPHRFQAAYEATAAARASLTPQELASLNLDLDSVVTTAIASSSRVGAIRDQILGALPQFDPRQIDDLETYAEALAHAQTLYLAASASARELPALAERATRLRATLLADATVLANRGLLEGDGIRRLRGRTKYLGIASDLAVLARMLREQWDEIFFKTATSSDDLDEAEELFERITFAVAERSKQSGPAERATEERLRAFTLVARVYDRVRRAVIYVRWEERDFDKIAPSLWAGRRRRATGPLRYAGARRPIQSVVVPARAAESPESLELPRPPLVPSEDPSTAPVATGSLPRPPSPAPPPPSQPTGVPH